MASHTLPTHPVSKLKRTKNNGNTQRQNGQTVNSKKHIKNYVIVAVEKYKIGKVENYKVEIRQGRKIDVYLGFVSIFNTISKIEE